MKKHNKDFLRAKNMVIQDKYDFHQEQFSKDLQTFLSNYFQFDGMVVQTEEGKHKNMVINISVRNVKKTHIV